MHETSTRGLCRQDCTLIVAFPATAARSRRYHVPIEGRVSEDAVSANVLLYCFVAERYCTYHIISLQDEKQFPSLLKCTDTLT